MSSSKKLICIIILTIVAVLAAAAVSYADEYRIYGAEWDDGDQGHVYAIWDDCDEKTSYYVILCKEGHTYYDSKGKIKDRSGERDIKDSICKWRRVSNGRVDFGPEMSAFGSGTYYFLVLPEKMYPDKKNLPYDRNKTGKSNSYYDPVYGNSNTYMVRSEKYELSSDEKGTLKKSVDTAAKAALDSITYTPGWVKGMGGIWMYAGPDGKLYKDKWIEENGKKYYIGTDYLMATGWTIVKSKYYYFGNDVCFG